MPTYTITAPDGQEYDVTAPEGATQEQVLAYAQANYKPKSDFSDVTARIDSAGRRPNANNSDFASLITGKKPKRGAVETAIRSLPGVGALDAFQHHLVNVPIGIAQLAGNTLDSGIQKVAGGTDFARNSAQVNAQRNAEVREREADYQERTDGNAGSYAGAIAGEVLPWLYGIGELRALGLIPKATSTGQKVGLLAGEGALMGAAQPVTGEGSYGAQKGAQVALGAAAGPVLMGAGKAVGGVRNAAEHVFRPERVADANVARLFGANQQTADALRNAQRFIPGETPTAAQVLRTPESVQAERALRNNPAAGPAFATADNTNNAARMDVIRRLGGDDAQLQAAVQARRAATGSYYKENLSPSTSQQRYSNASKVLEKFGNSRSMDMAEFKVVDEARKIVNRVTRGNIDEAQAGDLLSALSPRKAATKKALEQAQTAINKNMVGPSRIEKQLHQLTLSGNPTVANAANSHLALLARNKDARGLVPARALDDMRQNIGSMLSSHTPNGVVGSQEAALYGPVSAKIASTLDRAIPGYRANLATYARTSEPINTMESVQRLLDPNASGSLNAAGDPLLTAARLKTVLRGDDKARYPMSDSARAELEAVRESLARRSISDSKISASGPGTAADLQAGGALASAMFGSTLGRQGGWLGRTLGTAAGGAGGAVLGGPAGAVVGAGIGSGLSDGIGAVNSRIARQVGEKAASSDLSAEAVEAYLRRQEPGQLRLFMERYALPYQTP